MIKFFLRQYWAWRTLRAYKKWQLVPGDCRYLAERRIASREYTRCMNRFFNHGGERIALSS